MTIINKVGQYLQEGRTWYTRSVENIKVFSVHHSASVIGEKTDEEILQELMADHTKQGWPGLSYHYVIIRGNVYQINSHDWVTWVDSINWDCIGICVVGYFHPPYDEQPSAENLQALGQLLDELSTNHPEFPAGKADVYGHRERYATACPGDNLFSYVLEYRSKVGEVAWKNAPIQTTDISVPSDPTTIAPGQEYNQDQLPPELFNVTNGQQVVYSGAQYIAHVNPNGTRSFTVAPAPVNAPENPGPSTPANQTPGEPGASQPVETPKYTETEHGEVVRQLEEARSMLQQKSLELTDINKKHSGFVALGYNSIDDVQRALAKKDDEIRGLLNNVVSVKKQATDLGTTIAANHEEDSTAIEMGIKALDELKTLKADYDTLLIALAPPKPELPHVLSHIDNLHRVAEAALKILEKQNVIKPEDVQRFQERGSNWLQQIASFLTVALVFGTYTAYFMLERGWK